MLQMVKQVKINQIKSLLVILFTTFLIGCGPVMCNPKNLRPITQDDKITITNPPSYKSTIGLGIVREILIQSGIYTAAGSDDSGIWYLGQDDCVKITVTDRGGAFGFPSEMIGVPTFQKGGIYIPNDPSKRVQLFTIYGDVPKAKNNTSLKNDDTKKITNTNTANMAATQSAISNTPSSATPMQAGVGAGIGNGIVAAFIEADRANIGNFVISAFQPPDDFEIRKFVLRIK